MRQLKNTFSTTYIIIIVIITVIAGILQTCGVFK
jgi:hypothetical protein